MILFNILRNVEINRFLNEYILNNYKFIISFFVTKLYTKFKIFMEKTSVLLIHLFKHLCHGWYINK